MQEGAPFSVGQLAGDPFSGQSEDVVEWPEDLRGEDPGRPIGARRDDLPTVGAELDGVHIARVSPVDRDRLARDRVPEARRPIPPRRDDRASVRAIRRIAQPSAWRAKDTHFHSRLPIP